MTTNEAAPGWGRSDLTIKLSKRRLEQMRRIAASLPRPATPTDAIDHALAATLAHESIEDRLDKLEDSMEAWAMEQRHEVDRIESAIAAVAKGIETLRALISEVASADDY